MVLIDKYWARSDIFTGVHWPLGSVLTRIHKAIVWHFKAYDETRGGFYIYKLAYTGPGSLLTGVFGLLAPSTLYGGGVVTALRVRVPQRREGTFEHPHHSLHHHGTLHALGAASGVGQHGAGGAATHGQVRVYFRFLSGWFGGGWLLCICGSDR